MGEQETYYTPEGIFQNQDLKDQIEYETKDIIIDKMVLEGLKPDCESMRKVRFGLEDLK